MQEIKRISLNEENIKTLQLANKFIVIKNAGLNMDDVIQELSDTPTKQLVDLDEKMGKLRNMHPNQNIKYELVEPQKGIFGIVESFLDIKFLLDEETGNRDDEVREEVE
ncbi:MAG: hypothetical protein HRT98_04405 [Mycoplasmatales bacterium]|nr:hypothetical protein [Mycoplasmatales bacterium]